jgi:hypothetical protein
MYSPPECHAPRIEQSEDHEEIRPQHGTVSSRLPSG